MNLLQLNIEGSSPSKIEVIKSICSDHDVDVVELCDLHKMTDVKEKKYGYIESEACECNRGDQSLQHLISDCETYRYDGRLNDDIRRREPRV